MTVSAPYRAKIMRRANGAGAVGLFNFPFFLRQGVSLNPRLVSFSLRGIYSGGYETGWLLLCVFMGENGGDWPSPVGRRIHP